jgi:hypothetical protein
MAKRKAYAPFSLTSEAGVAQTPVEGYIDVEQKIYPTVATGTINENGKWTGVKASDDEFIGFQTDVAVADEGTIISNENISMEGFRHIQVAFNASSAGGNGLRIEAVHPADNYLNLQPSVGEGVRQQIASGPAATTTAFFSALDDSANALSAGNWVVYTIYDRLQDLIFKFKLTNKTGGIIDTLQFAFRRLV